MTFENAAAATQCNQFCATPKNSDCKDFFTLPRAAKTQKLRADR